MFSIDMQTIVSLVETGCLGWRKGNDPEGTQSFQHACLLWLEWLEEWEECGDLMSADDLEPLTKSMQKLLDVLGEHDTIRATDILQYEIVPQLKSFQAKREKEA